MFLVKTERDKEKAMNPHGIDLVETLAALQLYFLVGIVYAAITPVLLPFILIFFGFAYFVYRHQIINVYNQQYESAGAFWPHVHTRIVAGLLISQLILMGLLSTKKAVNSTPFLLLLPIVTIAFHKYCKSRFEPAFRKYPLEEAMEKDEEGRVSEPGLNLKSYLYNSYLHPMFHSSEEVDLDDVRVDKSPAHHITTPPGTEPTSRSSTNHDSHHETEMHNVHHYQVDRPGNVYHYEVEPPGNAYHYEVESSNSAYHYEAEDHGEDAYHYEVEQNYNQYRYDVESNHNNNYPY